MKKCDIRFVFFGTSEFAVTILEELKKAGFAPTLVVTTPDKPQGRKLVLTPSPVKIWAEKENSRGKIVAIARSEYRGYISSFLGQEKSEPGKTEKVDGKSLQDKAAEQLTFWWKLAEKKQRELFLRWTTDKKEISNVVIVHGSNPTEKEAKEEKPVNERHWAPWLKKELEKRGIKVSNELYPEDWLPDYEKWKKVFEKNKINENIILVGHSAGTAFLLRWLSENKRKVSKVILIDPSVIKDGKYLKESKLKDFNYNSSLDRKSVV